MLSCHTWTTQLTSDPPTTTCLLLAPCLPLPPLSARMHLPEPACRSRLAQQRKGHIILRLRPHLSPPPLLPQLITKLVSTHKSSIQCISTFQSRGLAWEQVWCGIGVGAGAVGGTMLGQGQMRDRRGAMCAWRADVLVICVAMIRACLLLAWRDQRA